MKEIISVVILIVVILFVGKTEITLHPFSIRMEQWMTVVGIALISIGVSLMCRDSHCEGFKKGAEQGAEEVIKFINSVKEDSQ